MSSDETLKVYGVNDDFTEAVLEAGFMIFQEIKQGGKTVGYIFKTKESVPPNPMEAT